jgi:hypothetical protein
MKSKSPAKSLQRTAFSVLAGVEAVVLNQEEISGRFGHLLRSFFRSKRGQMSEEFANCRSDGSGVLRFTRRFGPLEDEPRAGRSFRFRLDKWRNNQEGFRLLWAIVQTGESSDAWGKMTDGGFKSVFQLERDGGWILKVNDPEIWSYNGTALAYQASSLFRFLIFDLLSCPRERLRQCPRQACQTPFFVARHPKQNYCSDVCAAEGRAKWKRQWWANHGKEWRLKRLGGISRKRR